METSDRSKARQWIQGHLGRGYGAPAVVVGLGLLAIALLLWTDQIRERQRTHFAFANALTDFKLKVATSHLWLEEGIAARNEVEMERAWSDFREASRLSDIVQNGGETENGWIPRLEDPEIRKRADDLTRIYSAWELNFLERFHSPRTSGHGSAIESRGDEIFDGLLHNADGLERIVEGRKGFDYVASRHLSFGIFLAWLAVAVVSATGLLRREQRRRRAEEALQRAKVELEIKVATRTQDLQSLNEQLHLELSERKKTEEALRERKEQLRALSAKLLTAQEMERRRISKELHDDLGHSLVLMKLRLGLIEKALAEDPSTIGDDCRYLAQSIDQVIDDVRRLSRNLMPSVLEDLGLSGALRWLADNYSRHGQINVVSSIIDVDPLVSLDERIVLYRIIQEALTNARKHAQARQVSLKVEKHGDQLSFVVQDDGKGFDVSEAVARSATARGLGLATMQERARMLDGSLNVWSELGKGTRITLGVPVRNGNGGHLS